MDEQSMSQEQGKRSYEDSPWIDVWDFQVTEHERQDGSGSWWDVKLASGTTIEHNGQRLDVSGYHFASNYEPKVAHGKIGDPKTVRGIHFPNDWEITLKRFTNTAPENETPVFKEVDRIEGVTPKELVAGLHERAEAWKATHKRQPREEQGLDQAAQKVPKPDRSNDFSI